MFISTALHSRVLRISPYSTNYSKTLPRWQLRFLCDANTRSMSSGFLVFSFSIRHWIWLYWHCMCCRVWGILWSYFILNSCRPGSVLLVLRINHRYCHVGERSHPDVRHDEMLSNRLFTETAKPWFICSRRLWGPVFWPCQRLSWTWG